MGEITKKPPKMLEEGQEACLKWLQSNPDPEEIIRDLPYLQDLSGTYESVKGWELMSQPEQADFIEWLEANNYLLNLALEKLGAALQTRDSGRTFASNSPVIKNLIRREKGEIVLGKNEETGEAAIFTLLDGYLTPYEKESLECIAKFWLDGQITKSGNIWHTVGQLYRAMRHGAGTQSPTKEQRDAIIKMLNGLERKITYKLNDYLKIWGGFETNGGRVPLLSFSEYFGKINGQEDLLIVHSEISIACLIAKNLNMYERPKQELKAVKTRRYTLELKEPITIGGKAVRKRSFASNEDRVKFCKKHGVTSENIASFGDSVKPWALSENRIALRNTLQDFVLSYIRARAANRLYSNKLPYSTIFERCEVNQNSREAVKRAKADIAIILDHFVSCAELPELKGWAEYKNQYSDKGDGVQIFLEARIESEG